MNRKLVTFAATVLLIALTAVPLGEAQSQEEAAQQQTPPCFQEGRFSFANVPPDPDGFRGVPIYVGRFAGGNTEVFALVTISNESTSPSASVVVVGSNSGNSNFWIVRTLYPGNSISMFASGVELSTQSSEVIVGRYVITVFPVSQ